MAGTNKNYTLGKGKVYIELFDKDSTIGHGEIYFAQSTEFSFTVASETLDHYDADEGLNVLDDQVMTQVDVTGALSTDDVSMEKLALFLLADSVTTVTQTAQTGVTTTLTDVKRGRYFQLGATDTMPQGLRDVTVTAVTKSGTAVAQATNWSQSTDDIKLGRIYIEAAAPGIADLDDLVVTYSIAAANRSVVVSKDRQLRAAVRFVSANPTGGQRDFYFPLTNITPDGDYALKGDEWQTMGFSFTALKKNASVERVYCEGRALA